MNIRKNKKGFTLMELVVTTAIMGTLASVAIPSFIETNLKAKANKTIANLSDIGSAIGQKFNELANDFGSVEVFPNLSPPSGTEILTTGTVALRAWNGGGVYSNAATAGRVQLTMEEVTATVPVSPFGDKPYSVILVQQSSSSYTAVDGNVVPVVQAAKVTYTDPEEPTVILAKFSY